MRVLVDGFTVREASSRLGVSRARVQALLDVGVLAGERVGGQWVIPASQVERLARIPKISGRPFDQVTAWRLIRDFATGARSTEDLPGMWGPLNARAQSWQGHVLPECSGLELCPVPYRLGGASAGAAAGAAVRPGEPLDVYLPSTALAEFVAWSGFQRVTNRPNITLHAVDPNVWDEVVADGVPLEAAWLDLADAGDRGASEVLYTLRTRRLW